MHLASITDPRSALDRTRRKDMQKYIEANGLDIDPWMPKDLMVKRLHAMGVTKIDAPLHQLGQPDNYPSAPANGAAAQDGPSVEVDATDLLEAQWRAKTELPRAAPSVDEMSMQELRKMAKQLGLKQKRTDKMDDLRELLRDRNAS